MNNNPTDEQLEIINAKDSHLLVKAGAGSGKSTTIVERMMALIRNGIPPQDILGLTFTVKAARELERKAEIGIKKIQEEGKKTTGSIKVQTYDSFMQGIVRTYGLLIGVDPNLSPLSDAGISQCIADVINDGSSLINPCFEDIYKIDPDFSRPPSSPYKNFKYGNNSLQEAVKKITSQVLNFFIDKGHLTFKEAISGSREWNEKWIAYLSSKDICGGASESEESEDSNAGKKDKKDPVKEAKKLLCQAKLRRLVMDLSEKYAEKRGAENLAEYGDFTMYALRLIAEYPSISSSYKDAYEYVFLDEYQDTNYVQGILIGSLFEGASVMAVGDSQQSIYGFRGSMPGAFDLFRGEFNLDECKDRKLSETFRNGKNVVGLANCLTGKWLEEKDRLELKSEKTGDAIVALAYKDEEAGHRAVLEFIRREQSKNEQVAILARKNDDLPPYKEFLEENGIECVLTGKSQFDDENPISRDLKNLLAVCSDPFASMQAEELLCSPRYGLGLEDLKKLCKAAESENKKKLKSLSPEKSEGGTNREGNRCSPTPAYTLPLFIKNLDPETCRNSVSEEGRKILEDFRKTVGKAEASLFMGVEAAVTAAWEALDLDADVAIFEAAKGHLPYEKLSLEDALEAARSYEADLSIGESPSLQGFLAWLENYEKKSAEEKSPEAVELMTIHQAKGLEWDNVVVVSKEWPSHRQLTHWFENYDCMPENCRLDLQYCSPEYKEFCEEFNNPKNFGNTPEELCEKLQSKKDVERRKYDEEEAHAAYVAVTRTKGDLLLASQYASNLKLKDKNNGFLSDKGALGGFWHNAVEYLCGKDPKFWPEGAINDERGYAIYSNPEGESLKSSLEGAMKNAKADEAEAEAFWPMQIGKKYKDILQASAEAVKEAESQMHSSPNVGGLAQKAERLLKFAESGRGVEATTSNFDLVSATVMQKLASGGLSRAQSRALLLRPMPLPPAKAAKKGTKFHEWVASKLDPSGDGKGIIEVECPDKGWKKAFENSVWSERKVYGVEKPYVFSFGGALISCKLDAIFKGDLNGESEDSKFTIVDWKTGKVPKTDEEREEKLIQLDIYRLCLSEVLETGIGNIDACLYYVQDSEQINAEGKSAEDISITIERASSPLVEKSISGIGQEDE